VTVEILLADSVTALTERHAGHVIVTGSHGGLIAAHYAAEARVRAVVFNDAGRGKDDAGIAGLAALARLGIPAAAVTHESARIGDAAETLVNGIVGACNTAATALGAQAGMSCTAAVQRMSGGAWRIGEVPARAEARRCVIEPDVRRSGVWLLDSIGLVTPADAGATLVVGSHGALHGGDPATALRVAARAAIFHDAGRGKDDAGITRLPVLAQRGIAAAAVDFRTARIGDAASMWASGVLSVVNAVAAARDVRAGMPVRDAVERLR
jgi:hypothetical protein